MLIKNIRKIIYTDKNIINSLVHAITLLQKKFDLYQILICDMHGNSFKLLSLFYMYHNLWWQLPKLADTAKMSGISFRKPYHEEMVFFIDGLSVPKYICQ